MADDILLTRKMLEAEVDRMVGTMGMTHIEAVLEVAESRGMEVESVAALVGPYLEAKIEENAMDLHFIERRPTIPADW